MIAFVAGRDDNEEEKNRASFGHQTYKIGSKTMYLKWRYNEVYD